MLSRVIFLICCILMGDIVIASKPLSILVVETVPSPSHHVWTEHLVKGLLRKGHHVHAVSILETKVKGKLAQNLTYAVFDDLMDNQDTYIESNNYDPVEWQKYSVFYTAYFVYQWSIHTCDTMIKTGTARDLLKVIKTVEFDVIVQDVSFTQCFYGLWENIFDVENVKKYVKYFLAFSVQINKVIIWKLLKLYEWTLTDRPK